ncbi:orotidine-5'-phosphate decarboxylase, partial [Staphylococcus aureus]|nr:orotidine-5'-phosphate decarboxylase [Staphylococcus aureus]
MNPLISDFQTPQQRTPVIVALDFSNEKDTLGFVRNL